LTPLDSLDWGDTADGRRRLVIDRGRIAAERDNLVIAREAIATELRRPILAFAAAVDASTNAEREAGPRTQEPLDSERERRLEELRLLRLRRRDLVAERERLIRHGAQIRASRERLLALRKNSVVS
jgi:hypothetical protein